MRQVVSWATVVYIVVDIMQVYHVVHAWCLMYRHR